MNNVVNFAKGEKLSRTISDGSTEPEQVNVELLTNRATTLTLKILKGYGSVPNEAHAKALRSICQRMAELYLGEKQGRFVFDLPTAMGKTTAIRGFIRAIEEIGLRGRVVVCCEKVKAICDLKRVLTEQESVPEDRICLLHSYKYDPDYDVRDIPRPQTAPYESDKGVDEGGHQFVLITHSKLHGGFQNLSHSLLIYDEGLALGKSYPLIVGELRSRLLGLKGKIEADRAVKDETVLTLLGWLRDTETILLSIINKETTGEIALPRLGLVSFDEHLERYVRRVVRDSFDSGSVDLESVIDFIRKAGSGEMVRIIETNGIYAVVFKPTIPDTLQRLVILDASFNIRMINNEVPSLICHRSYADLKDCSDITIHFAKARSGRQWTFSKLLVDQDSELIREAAKLTAKLIDAAKGVLLFIHKDASFNEAYIQDPQLKERWANKPRGHRKRHTTVAPVEMLRAALREELGTDELPDSVYIATWGYETAENKWGHVDAVVFVTVNELPSASVYTRRIDQMQDPSIEVSNSELRAMIKSEKAHQILQAIGRGGRKIVQGKTAKLDAYVFSTDWEEIKPYLVKALHDVKLTPYEPLTDTFREKLPKTERIRLDLLNTLDEYSEDTISQKKLWEVADPENVVAARTRRRAITTLCADPSNPWYRPEGSRKLTNLTV